MSRTVKHFSLHRISGVHPEHGKGTELRVVADVEEGVLSLIEVETAVIRGYTRQEHWPHHWVTLFILEDLQPLVRQLRLGANSSSVTPSGPSLGHPADIGEALIEGQYPAPEEGADLNHRPVVNIYDLADLAGCNIFINRRAMVAEGYWDDPLAIQGLLAHEHAHPLAENETTRASRRLKFEISDLGFQIEKISGPGFQIRNLGPKITSLLTFLAMKLCLYAPRELFANEITIRDGFAEALSHLDLRNVDNASRSVAGREGLSRQLQQEVTQGSLTPAAADLLLLIGDLNGYLDLALEVAPFYRTGRFADGRALEATLEAAVFPRLDPLVPRTFTALRDQYIALGDSLSPAELINWTTDVLDALFKDIAEKSLNLLYRLWMDEERETR